MPVTKIADAGRYTLARVTLGGVPLTMIANSFTDKSIVLGYGAAEAFDTLFSDLQDTHPERSLEMHLFELWEHFEPYAMPAHLGAPTGADVATPALMPEDIPTVPATDDAIAELVSVVMRGA